MAAIFFYEKSRYPLVTNLRFAHSADVSEIKFGAIQFDCNKSKSTIMQSVKKILAAAMATAALLATLPAGAQTVQADTSGDEGFWQQTKNRISAIADHGSNELYLSGYAYHGRDTYTQEKLDELNEKTWGGGFGRTLRNASGNDESLYFMGISDSHEQPQLMAGYAYEWIWPVAGSGVEAGLGYTAMMMSRQDYFGGVPFPVALPVASLGVKGAKLMASYVPRLSKNKNNGDVLFMFMRVELP
jgi:hypothetical protein